ncbi:MAG: glycosyltransferase family 2 protein [Candidatus Xenobiia bacterium LiM19]
MNDPVFSIITPTYKRPILLRRAIKSVLGQSFGSFELIIVDDANEPATCQIVQQFNDSRIRVIQHASNMGAAAAFNTGIRASTGAFISFLGDDDEYYPLFLERTYHFFESASPDIGFIWTGVRIYTETGEGEMSSYDRVWPSFIESKEDSYIEATTIGNGFGMTLRRECLSVTGLYNEAFRVCVDTELLFKLVQNFGFATIPEVLVKIYQHQNHQLTGMKNDGIRLETHERILNDNIDFVVKYPRLFRMHFERLVELSYSVNRNQKGRQIIMKLIKREPRRAFRLLADLICYEFAHVNSKTICERMLRLINRAFKKEC